MATSILPTRLEMPMSAAVKVRQLTYSTSTEHRPEFSSLVATGNHPAVKPGQLVEKGLARMLLGNMVEIMLPKEAEAITGKSLSGDYWKSLLAGAVADALSKSGKINLRIADQ
jgi:hypothetical protein